MNEATLYARLGRYDGIAAVADGVMLADTPLQRIEDTVSIIRGALSANKRAESAFRISNLYSWHVKPERDEAMAEARAKLWIRGMLDPYYLSTFMDDDDCKFVEDHFDAFGKAYMQNSPVIEGVPDRIVNALVEHLTFTGNLDDVDRLTENLLSFKNAGVNEFGIRLYDQPEDSIRLIGERVLPALH